MASALLASRNEPYYWGGEPKVVCMRKAPPNPYPNSSSKIPSHNPNPSLVTTTHTRYPLDTDDFPSGAAAAASDGSSSLCVGHRKEPFGSYRTFNISTCSRKELRDLKRLLVKELEIVRSVASRIESRDSQHRPGRGPSHVPPPAAESPREQHMRPSMESEKVLAAMMKKCGQILTKLMKHKGGVWFNTPVDVDGMGLHDYHQIVKIPMDLGTVKTKLNKGLYPSPLEFAADIKLTFKNALLYNPEGHDVNKIAGQLLKLFEGLFYPSYEKYEKQQSAISREGDGQLHRSSSWSTFPATSEATVRSQTSAPAPVAPLQPPPPPPKPSAPAPVHPRQQPQPPPPQMQTVAPRPAMGKLPKPKAKEPNKRPMSLEEKQKLSVGLQSLPDEKMEQVVQIVKRRNGDPAQHGDEIELDFELMDIETLWELDRFVCNCRKAISKIKRQEALAGGSMGYAAAPSAQAGSKSPTMVTDTHEPTAFKKMKRGEPGDEDVDIVDDMPSTHYPPVEIEKDVGVASSSSSSGSDSSSSSGSDSGSSSGSDSDGDDAQSPAVGSRPSPRN